MTRTSIIVNMLPLIFDDHIKPSTIRDIFSVSAVRCTNNINKEIFIVYETIIFIYTSIASN